MLLHSEVEAQPIIPFLRTTVARILIDKYSLTQQQSAKKMGITQATISNYMNRSRGNIELYLITERIQLYSEIVGDLDVNEAPRSQDFHQFAYIKKSKPKYRGGDEMNLIISRQFEEF